MGEKILTTGSLFTHDYVWGAIREDKLYQGLDIGEISAQLKLIYESFPNDKNPNEAKTEDDLIWPILDVLGWKYSSRQQNLSVKGRDDVPDGILFQDIKSKQKADNHQENWKAYEYGNVIVESKRFGRSLDRSSSSTDETIAPSTQMIRYLRRVDDITEGKLRWGFLTNGSTWRLYFQGARSVSEEYFEINLADLFYTSNNRAELENTRETEADREHLLRVFYLMFSRVSFSLSGVGSKTFHQNAIQVGKFYEERVAESLSKVVFDTVFPMLAEAIYQNHKKAPIQDIHQASLIMLYRLLFLLYAEDRNLLPVNEERYDDYGLRKRVRKDIGKRKDAGDIFSDQQPRYWSIIDALSNAVDKGDQSIGLPPYNGGLFNRDATPLLSNITIPDTVMAEIIDLLSFERFEGQRRYINYRDLSVQQLGSIYERLLEFELKIDPTDGLIIRPNISARKSSGSYYTPHDLVDLIISNTLEPLTTSFLDAFNERVDKLANDDRSEEDKIIFLKRIDPAEAILNLRICDPAMGSGHFLVNLVDHLSGIVIDTIAEISTKINWTAEPYISPLVERIAKIRNTILQNAEDNKWTVDVTQLDDKHIIKRMILKRCVYGVDKNKMAVELAKVSLWLHTFTVGAPLSFLDHHLRCGDSLFGEWVEPVLRDVTKGRELLMKESVDAALGSAASMQTIEGLTDAEISEAHKSAQIFSGVKTMIRPLDNFMKLWHALKWLALPADKKIINAWLDGVFGDPILIASGAVKISVPRTRDASEQMQSKRKKKSELSAAEQGARFKKLYSDAIKLMTDENFLNWETSFPGVWTDWENNKTGGFDAIIGNPPWEKIKLDEKEWFELRMPSITNAEKASDRKRMISDLHANNHPLSLEYTKAQETAKRTIKAAQKFGEFPQLSGGDINLYSLFVEKSLALLNDSGVMGLLVPSGIATDKSASKFFKNISISGHVKSFYDFENRKNFFTDVDARFKFCAFVASKSRAFLDPKYAFYLHNTKDIDDSNRLIGMTASDILLLNPNTGTLPVIRAIRDFQLIKSIYEKLPIFNDLSGPSPVCAWPVKYTTMFHMTDDSNKFKNQDELTTQEGAWKIGGNLWESANGKWVSLYEGKMINQFDHRAASIVINNKNQANSNASKDLEKSDPFFSTLPRFWINESEIKLDNDLDYFLAFRDIARATDNRTMICSLVPRRGVGNTAPLIVPDNSNDYHESCTLILANLNSIILDYVARQKIQSAHASWYIVEQLPVVTKELSEQTKFGDKSAIDIIKPIVLELVYTSHDMAPYAIDMDYLGPDDKVLPPYTWDVDRRFRLRAKLDAIFFHLYGVFDEKNIKKSQADISYIYSTFPILEKYETNTHGSYKSRDLTLAYCNSLAAGQPDAEPII